MLVPMLQALYIHGCVLLGLPQAEYFNSLAQLRCETGPEDAIMPLPRIRNTLDMFSIRLKIEMLHN